MKTAAKILVAMFLLLSFTVNAQMNQGQNQQTDHQQNMMQGNNMMSGNNIMQGNMMYGNNMMQGNMMNYGMCSMCGNMMNQNMPMQNCFWVVRNLPDMKDQLSLSDEQLNKMIDLRTEYTKQQVELTAEMSKNQMKIEKMLNSNPSTSEVKEQLMQCANIQVDLGVAAWETSAKMKALLSSEQKDKLNNLMQENNIQQNNNMMQGSMMQNMNYH